MSIHSNFVAGRPNPHCFGWYEYGNRPAAEVGMQWLCAGATLNQMRPDRNEAISSTVPWPSAALLRIE